jgi:hypothetical protein
MGVVGQEDIPGSLRHKAMRCMGVISGTFITIPRGFQISCTDSSAEKKLADFGTSNNIATSAFNSLINRTKMFLVSYCNLSNN